MPPPFRTRTGIHQPEYRWSVIDYEWRGRFDNAEANGVHAEAFGHPLVDDDWWAQVNRHSLGWVCARRHGRLVGFVNVAWDGGVHAFLLDPVVVTELQRQGVGARLVALVVEHVRLAGCEWLHVDFDDHLGPFYLGRCGFRSTSAGLIGL
ncbi:MAG: GNAT family N-acetyltransferase [Actinomycetes bacterium]